VGAKDTATTAAFMPHWALLDTHGSCKYVAMLMRCDNPDSPWATAQVQPRVEIRERYAIRGNVINDWLASLCCTSCALTQERREVEVEEASFQAVQQVVQVDEK
jgi:Cys-rich protein (TIGR01571 family)